MAKFLAFPSKENNLLYHLQLLSNSILYSGFLFKPVNTCIPQHLKRLMLNRFIVSRVFQSMISLTKWLRTVAKLFEWFDSDSSESVSFRLTGQISLSRAMGTTGRLSLCFKALAPEGTECRSYHAESCEHVYKIKSKPYIFTLVVWTLSYSLQFKYLPGLTFIANPLKD